MFPSGDFIGIPHEIDDLRLFNTKLCNKVLESVTESQALVVDNNIARETSENNFRDCVQKRISVIRSWHWVFEDLCKRLVEAVPALKYEHKALYVIIRRIDGILQCQNEAERMKPSVTKLVVENDNVELFIKEEQKYLREQKQNFEKMILMLEKRVSVLEKTERKIANDIVMKNQAVSVEEACLNICKNNMLQFEPHTQSKRKLKKRGHNVELWEKRCEVLKKEGLKALKSAANTRQQVRRTRKQLSVAAHALAKKVDLALRRRLHVNISKLQELQWQNQEILRDIAVLDTELLDIERTLVENLDHVIVIQKRLAERTQRPKREQTKDQVDAEMRAELGSLKLFDKNLRANRENIITLQRLLQESTIKIEDCVADLVQVINIDEERTKARHEGEMASRTRNKTRVPFEKQAFETEVQSHQEKIRREDDFEQTFTVFGSVELSQSIESDMPTNITEILDHRGLHTIKEDDEGLDEEEDDYPFPY